MKCCAYSELETGDTVRERQLNGVELIEETKAGDTDKESYTKAE